MPPYENIIQNGDFENGFANWSGFNLEVNKEDRYLDNGSENIVFEMDETRNTSTVLIQSFTITEPISTTLTLDVALRDEAIAAGSAGGDGFIVEILDSSHNVIATQTVLPTNNTFSQVSMPVNFTSAGGYTLRFREIGDDDSLGAIIDNIELLVCFAGGTKIMTPRGQVRIEDLAAGDLVMTNGGPKALRWVGRRVVTPEELQDNPKLLPVQITAGALGRGLPTEDLRVSRQHRMVVDSPVAVRMFDDETVLVAAIRLTELPGIFIQEDAAEVTYYHLLFDAHELVFANGAPSESLLTGPEAMKSMSDDAREEILTMFPSLAMPDAVQPCVLPVPSGKRQKALVRRILKNDHQPLHHI